MSVILHSESTNTRPRMKFKGEEWTEEWILKSIWTLCPGQYNASNKPFDENMPDFETVSEDPLAFLKSVGDWLFQSLGHDTQKQIDNFYKTKPSSPLRLVIQESRKNNLPWEFLFHRKTDKFLVLNNNISIVRYSGLRKEEEVLPNLQTHPNLMVHPIAVNPRVNGEFLIHAHDVEVDLQEGLCKPLGSGLYCKPQIRPRAGQGWQLEVQDLQSLLQGSECTLLHLAAHGSDSTILLSKNDGVAAAVTGSRLGGALRNASKLQVVVLVTCGGASQHLDYGVSTKLAVDVMEASWVPWVLACRVPLSSRSVRTFFPPFYRALVRGETLEAAVGYGRRALLEAKDYTFGSFVLYVWSPTQNPVLFRIPEQTNDNLLANPNLIKASGYHRRLAGANLESANFAGVDLSGADFSQANLSRATLEKARLVGANFAQADLSGANLEGANLEEANLSGAELAKANLNKARYNKDTVWPEGFDYASKGAIGPGAFLAGADLSGANLEGADLCGAYLYNTNLRGTNLKGADLSECNLITAELTGAELAETVFTNANLIKAVLNEAALAGADLSRTLLGGTDFAGACLTHANLTGADMERSNLTKAYLTGANLSRTRLKEANLERANLEGANLEGADLTRANLEGANLRDADLTGATLAGVNLTKTNLTGTVLVGATFEGKTLQGSLRTLDDIKYKS